MAGEWLREVGALEPEAEGAPEREEVGRREGEGEVERPEEERRVRG